MGVARRLLLLAPCVVVASTFWVSTALGSSSGHTAVAVTFQLVAPKCAAPHVALGGACVDKSGLVVADKWTVGATSAQWNVPGQWQISYEWTVPQTIPPRGAAMTMKLTATELIGGPGNRICPAMGARGGFEFAGEPSQPVVVGFCAEAGGTKSGAKSVKLVPSSAAPVGSIAYLTVGLQDGAVYTYQYRAVAQTTKPGVTSKPACRRTQASGQAPTKIQQSAEYQTFLGLCDAKTAPTKREWGTWLVARSREYVDRVARFPGVRSEGLLEGEESIGEHSARIVPGVARTDLMVLLSESDAPAELWRGGNVFVLATVAGYERELRKLIVASKGGLLPADVIELALKVTKGSYPLAALTAHNLLKNVTVSGRELIRVAAASPAVFQRTPERFLAPLRELNKVVAKLSSLRQCPAERPDKMGPWYHIMAVTTAGALSWSAGTAREIVDLEHGAKKINFFAGEGGHDVIKHQIDHCFGFAAGEREVARVSRFWESSLFAELFANVHVEDCLLGAIKFATD